MKEKLTKEWLIQWFETVERINGARPDVLAVWAKIEADREAIRAEQRREELLRFEGVLKAEQERIRAETRGEFVAVGPYKAYSGNLYRWRGGKSRAKSPTELVADFTRYAHTNLKGDDLMFAIMSVWGNPETADMDFLRDYCRDHGIATEVDE